MFVQWPADGITPGLSACLIFFAARFSFKVLPCFFTLLFWGDLLDIATLPHNVRMVIRPQTTTSVAWSLSAREPGKPSISGAAMPVGHSGNRRQWLSCLSGP
jgi:hypothetical protein